MEMCTKFPSSVSSFVSFFSRAYYESRYTSEKAVRSGEEFGAAVHSVEALEVPLSDESSEACARNDGTISGFKLLFNCSTDEYIGVGREPHPYNGSTTEMVVGPDDLHQTNHRDECRKKQSTLFARQ